MLSALPKLVLVAAGIATVLSPNPVSQSQLRIVEPPRGLIVHMSGRTADPSSMIVHMSVAERSDASQLDAAASQPVPTLKPLKSVEPSKIPDSVTVPKATVQVATQDDVAKPNDDIAAITNKSSESRPTEEVGVRSAESERAESTQVASLSQADLDSAIQELKDIATAPVTTAAVASAANAEKQCSDETYGTKLAWAPDARTASERARAESKLVFVIQVSGNFAREEFT